MAKFEYKFPELGEGLHEGEIIKMHIKVGDKVTDEDIVMEVQNDKAVVEVPCPVNGTVTEVFAKDGDVFHVGQVVAVIDAEGELPEQDDAPADQAAQEKMQLKVELRLRTPQQLPARPMQKKAVKVLLQLLLPKKYWLHLAFASLLVSKV